MFVIPTGIMLGAKVSLSEWWMWNQIPVTLGNIVGGFFCTGFALYVTYKPAAKKQITALPVVARALVE
jgi:formate transporter